MSDHKLHMIRAAWENGTDGFLEALYDLSDGYGEPGYIPSQGYDWSGIRDSSDEAIDAMYEFCLNHISFTLKRRYSGGK